jgi:RNA recognition motif-containing protein
MPIERPPPPGTPGVSSGYQVVVHNLPWSITWQELKDIFSHTPGVVRADVIIDSTGRSRGFGTVRYKNQEEARRAAEMMNNTEIGGRVVSVRIDRFA